MKFLHCLCLVVTASFFGLFATCAQTTINPNKTTNGQPSIRQLTPSALGLMNSIPGQGGLLLAMLAGQNVSEIYKTLQGLLPALPLLLESGLKGKSISPRCSSDMSAVLNATSAGKQWAMKMLDASGKIPRGLMKGNLNFMGQYDECREVTSGSDGSSSELGHVIKGTTCVAYISPPRGSSIGSVPPDLTGAILIKWHLCVPDTCRKDDIRSLVNGSLPMNLSIFAFCRDQELPDFSTDAGAIVSLVIICILLAFVCLGSLLDVWKGCLTSKNKYDLHWTREPSAVLKIKSENQNHSGTTTIAEEGITNPEFEPDKCSNCETVNNKVKVNGMELSDVSSAKPQVMTIQNDSHSGETSLKHEAPIWQRLLLSFSAFSNSTKILSTRASRGSIGCLHGIRVISISWVILGHTFLFMYPFCENPLEIQEYVKSVWFQLILNAGVSVDTFFLLSGILTAYLFLRETRKSRRVTCKQMTLYYFHRYWRLTPALMMWLMIYTTLLRYMGDGPEWTGPADMKQCKDMGWLYNMLYITNFIPRKDNCVGISWFLSNDMQFYIIAPLALIPLTYRFKKIGLGVISAFIIMHIVSTATLVTKYNASILVENEKYVDYIYTRPYARIAPYAIGLALGYALQKMECKAKINWVKQFLFWFLSVGVSLTIMYVTYNENGEHHIWSAGGRAAFETCSRVGWALAVSWVIFVCATGNGGYVNSILSWEGWLPMSRLTYGAYLIHVPVMTYSIANFRVGAYFSLYNIISWFFAYCCTTYILAFVSSLIIEAPLLGIEKVLLKKH